MFVRFGVHQKRYKCFDPIHDKMYTTMDYDFFEDSFYYTQLTSLEESTCGDLSWLTYWEMTQEAQGKSSSIINNQDINLDILLLSLSIYLHFFNNTSVTILEDSTPVTT